MFYCITNGAGYPAVPKLATICGGRVEGDPEDTEGRKASPAFLFNGAVSTFERLGFERSRLVGKHRRVVTLTID